MQAADPLLRYISTLRSSRIDDKAALKSRLWDKGNKSSENLGNAIIHKECLSLIKERARTIRVYLQNRNESLMLRPLKGARR